MDNTNKFNFDLDAIAWGAFFILWGITTMFKSLPDGVGAMSIGLILISLNAIRAWTGCPTSIFTTIFGVLALLLGGLEMARSLLHLTFELPIFAILLIALGLITLARELRKK